MALTLTGFVFDNAGNAISGATVQGYVSADAASSTAEDSVTTDSNGKWAITTSTASRIPMDVKITYGSNVRWIKAGDKLNVTDMTVTGTLTVGEDAAGFDFALYSSDSAGDGLTWDASEEVLQITGKNGATSLDVLDGDVRIVDKLYFYDRGGEYLSSDGSTLTITGATTIGALSLTSMSSNWTNASRTVADMGIVTTIDINGGTIDGAVIGGASAAAVTGTAVTGTSLVGGTVAGTTGTFSGVVDITDTTDASDATGDTGALRTEGGASIAKKLYVGTDLSVDGTANLDNTDIDGTLVVDGSNISLDSTSTLNIDNSNTSNGISIGTATSSVPINIGHGTSLVTIGDNLTVTGDLTVSGTTTTVTSTTVAIADSMLLLAKDQGTSSDAVDFGIYGKYGVGGTAKYAGIFRDLSATNDPWTFFDELQAEPGTTVNTGGTGYALAAITAAEIVGTTIDAGTDFTVGATVITDGVITDASGLSIAAAVDLGSNTLTTTGSLQVRTIDYSDGDLAITIADGGGTTFAQDATFSGAVATGALTPSSMAYTGNLYITGTLTTASNTNNYMVRFNEADSSVVASANNSGTGASGYGFVTIDGEAIAGAYTFAESSSLMITGPPTQGASMTLTKAFALNVVAGNVSMAATAKLFLDGGNDTYIHEQSANVMQFFTADTHALQINASQDIWIPNGSVLMAPTEKLYFDNGNDTYIYESAGDTLDFEVGGVQPLSLRTNMVWIGSTGADDIDFRVDDTSAAMAFYVDAGTGDTLLAAGSKLRLDGSTGGDTYIYEESADDLHIVVGDVAMMQFDQDIGAAVISAAGSGPLDQALFSLRGAFTSGGGGTDAEYFLLGGTLNSASGDTRNVGVINIDTQINTQAVSETTTAVASMIVNEPNITKGSGHTITTAASIYVVDAPTEGDVTNAAIYVASGAIIQAAATYSWIGPDSLEGGYKDDVWGGTGLIINAEAVGGPVFQIKNSQLNLNSSNTFQYGDSDTESDSAFHMRTLGANGGAALVAQADDAAQTNVLKIMAVGGDASTTHSNAGVALIHNYTVEHTGTGRRNHTANSNIFGVSAYIGGGFKTVFLVDAEGDLFADAGTTTDAVTVYDNEDDISLVRAFDMARGGEGLIRSEWDSYVNDNESDLVRHGILGDTISNGGLVNVTRLQQLHNGAIWQLNTKHMSLADKVDGLEVELIEAKKQLAAISA